jgi:hypothetical protein
MAPPLAAAKAKTAALADVAVQAMGALLGQAFKWDGRLQSRNTNAPNVFSGTGVPATTNIPGRARIGDYYFRVDGGGAGATHLYYCTVAGAPGTWIGIA